MVTPELVGAQVITGISIGSRLFLIAVGLSLIFGVLEVLNFAHGALYMIGAYTVMIAVDEIIGSFWVGVLLLMLLANVVGVAVEWATDRGIGHRSLPIAGGLGVLLGVLGLLGVASGALAGVAAAAASAIGKFWLGILVAGYTVGVVGAVMEAGFLRRVYDRDHLDQLLLTFAFILILTDGVRIVFGSGSHAINPPSSLDFTIQFTQALNISAYRAFVILMSVVVMAGMFLVLRTTNVGRVIRATSSDRDMAQLLGINVPLLYTGVFFAGSVLAGIGGAFTAPLQSVTPELGNQVVVVAFVVVVIGGLGSFVGAFVGAMLIGLLIALGTIVVPGGAGQLFPFLAMIVVLLLRPEGLFGEATT